MLWSARAALGGPNGDGVLLVHCDPLPVACQEYACTTHGLARCEDAVVRIEDAQPHYWWVLAAFPEGSAPRLKAVTFGIDYPAAISLLSASACGDFELAQSGWPASGNGTAISWNAAQTAALTPVYLFSGYNYYAPSPAAFALTPHPVQGGDFADDSVPSVLDPIADYGVLGFATAGHRACPAPLPTGGACCFGDGTCARLDPGACAAQGGVYHGDGTNCQPGLCPVARWACCLPDGSCVELTGTECAAESNALFFEGQLCANDPCASVRGACCTPSFYCVVTLPTVCAQIGEDFQGGGTDCDPYPCPPPQSGACCFASGECRHLRIDDCVGQAGTFLGDGVPCDPNPCPQPPNGACCFRNGVCTVMSEYQCNAGGSTFLGEGTSCDPYPCPYGACCLADGICVVEEEEPCVSGGGSFLGRGTTCDPSPCPPSACCLDDGTCHFVTAQQCALLYGVFHAGESECGPLTCPPAGACCFSDNDCVFETEQRCLGAGGVWLGGEGGCVPNPCSDLIGACCLDDGSCLDLLESACFAQGGLYHGAFSDCGSTDCAGPVGCGDPGVIAWNRTSRAAVTTVGSTPLLRGAAAPPAQGACDLILQNSDGTYENGGAVRNQAVQPPYYGAWAECYHGAYEVCEAIFDFTQTGLQFEAHMDVYVWEDLGGCPGNVICLRANVDPGPIALWPAVSRHVVDLAGCCTSNDWWIGYWPNWPGQNNEWYTTFDLSSGSNGCPKICLAPGSFGVEGWQDASVLWGEISALGISAAVRSCAPNTGACCLADGSCVVTEPAQCSGEFQGVGTSCDPNPCAGPVPTRRMSWGKVKALYH